MQDIKDISPEEFYESDMCLDLIVHGGNCDGEKNGVDCFDCKTGNMKNVLVISTD